MDYVGYVRVSTEEQAASGISIHAQIAKIRDYCKLNGFNLAGTISDEGKSGKDLKRSGIDFLMDMVKKKSIQGIIVYKLDRISRSVIDTLTLIEKFDRAGIEFHSITEKIDTKSAGGRFFITILSALAQMERDLISERTSSALRYKRSIGGCAGGVPYGFKKIGKGKDSKLIINDAENKVLSQIKLMSANGESLNAIARALNGHNIRTRSGGKWYAQTIRSILQHSI